VIERRSLLAGAVALSAGAALGPRGAAAARGPVIRPRSDWGSDLPPTGPLAVEAWGDVRFLLVHHSAGANDYGAADVPAILRGIYGFHTGDRGWPDVAYNFFVDRYGGVWEGRSGSAGAPVRGDATGGSQGFALLCCLLGTFTDEPPTADARQALVGLLAALADTYAIDTTPGATTSFVSRGSNRWPAGAAVTATTIAGHRDMSQTACPGEALYVSIADGSLAAEVTAARGPLAAPTTSAPPPAPATALPPSPSSTTTASAPTTTTAPPETAVPSTTLAAAGAPIAAGPDEDASRGRPAVLAAMGAAVVVGGLLALRRRRAR
jgi:N-acetylmuramoyl-L-alanine amidase